MHLPYSEASEQNKGDILRVLQTEFTQVRKVLEIGSGTGQHAVYFAQQLPHLVWQTSDVQQHHSGIQAWLNEVPLANALAPLALDVDGAWPIQKYDGVFSANTAHIMSWPQIERMFAGVGKLLPSGGIFCLYGPFNYNGKFTSESNARFDQWLKARDSLSGVRDFEAINELAINNAMRLINDYAMQANNRTLVWQRV